MAMIDIDHRLILERNRIAEIYAKGWKSADSPSRDTIAFLRKRPIKVQVTEKVGALSRARQDIRNHFSLN